MGSSIFCVTVAIKIFGEALELLSFAERLLCFNACVFQFFFESSDMIYCWKMRHFGNTAKALPMMKKDFATHSYLRKLSRVSRS